MENMAIFSNGLMKSSVKNDVNEENFLMGAKTTLSLLSRKWLMASGYVPNIKIALNSGLFLLKASIFTGIG